MKITSEDAARYVVKAAYSYRDYERTAIRTGARSKATAVARAKFDGLADGADVLNLARTPHAFFMALKEAFEEVGDLDIDFAGRAEKAKAARLAWTDAMYAAVARRLS